MRVSKFISINSLDFLNDFLNNLPFQSLSKRGVLAEGIPTHYNYHKHAKYTWLVVDKSVSMQSALKLNKPKSWINIAVLRRMLESHNLIESLGGVEQVNKMLAKAPSKSWRFHEGEYFFKICGTIFQFNFNLGVWQQMKGSNAILERWHNGLTIKHFEVAIKDFLSIKAEGGDIWN